MTYQAFGLVIQHMSVKLEIGRRRFFDGHWNLLH